MADSPLTVDIWSDLACPWCYIGTRRFAEGLDRYAAQPGALPVVVEYHSFELSPDTPLDFEGSEVDFLAAFKGLPRPQVEQMIEQVRATAASVGLVYDAERLRHTRTLKAHQVLHLAKERGVQAEAVTRLFRAYFEEGRHLGRDEELAELGAEVGLNRDEVLAALRDETYAAAVEADLAQARSYGIRGVPFYVIDSRYGVSGAQDPGVFEQALTQAAGDRVPTGSA